MRGDLAALVGSRICHDLISPIGAIGNGVELLSLVDDRNGPEMALISESVENANARIRFFRIAYGGATVDQSVARSEVLSVLSASARGGRFTYFWQIDSDQSRRDVRIAFLLLQCFETAFPLGGDVTVSIQGDHWNMSATGPRLALDEGLWDSLTNPDTAYPHAASQVQFALLPTLIAEGSRDLRLRYDETTITARFLKGR